MGGDVSTRYYGLICETKEETRTAEEIVENIRNKINKISEVKT